MRASELQSYGAIPNIGRTASPKQWIRSWPRSAPSTSATTFQPPSARLSRHKPQENRDASICENVALKAKGEKGEGLAANADGRSAGICPSGVMNQDARSWKGSIIAFFARRHSYIVTTRSACSSTLTEKVYMAKLAVLTSVPNIWKTHCPVPWS